MSRTVRVPAWVSRAGARSPAELVRLLGRVLVWALLVLLLVRGAGAVLAGSARQAASARVSRPAAVWPDAQAEVFAASFARAYLSYSPRRPERYARALARFMPAELVSGVLPRFARRGSGQAVAGTQVARVTRLGRDRALVTVAVALAGEVAPRYLAVPIARDAGGGLSVFDAPGFVAPPATGQAEPPESEPVLGVERAGLEDVLARFFGAYVSGDAAGLRYLVPAGARVRALAPGLELVAVDSIAALPSAGRGDRVLLVGVRVRDVRSRATYPLRYRVALTRRDRWYVAAVNSTSREG